MLISKAGNEVIKNPIIVDKWNVKHSDGSSDLVESYEGKVAIDETEEQKYLGFIISSKGDNMKNITAMKNKSVWIIRKIFNRLQSLSLKKYFFECAILILNIMLRSSILYACETYYNLKEIELRALERIEENFLRKLFKTSKGCPIAQLYLEAGHKPARFAIFRTRLLFLKTILHDPESLLCKFVQLQFANPSKGDWVSSCLEDLNYLEMKMSLDEIKSVSESQYKNMLDKSINKKALEYLLSKRGSKGTEITYSCIKTAEYLSPNEEGLSISDQRYIFSIRNRMVPILDNFPLKQIESKCVCGNSENMKHIYSCKYLNIEDEETPYEKIFKENLMNMKKVYQRFKLNFGMREKIKTENFVNHGIPSVDPLYCTVMEIN
jgi:hypothetical protein